MISQRKVKIPAVIELLLIVVIAGVTYLPGLSRATIYRDDWYYTMDRLIGGPGAFQQMFSIDRPARGPLFEGYYQLFGINPLPYHLSSFLWRVLGGICAWWLFKLLFPKKRGAAFLMGLLFLLYPGYLRWMEGFENQPRILSSFLQVLSIALTVQAIRSPKNVTKVFAWIGSILTGWAYIALVDFAIGMEAFRLLCVLLVVQQKYPALSFYKKSWQTLRSWALSAVIPTGFLFWRLFIFKNERPATDVGLQLSYLVSSPLSTGLWWFVRLFQSVLNVAALAWAGPLFQNLFGLRLNSMIAGILLAGLAALLVFILLRLLPDEASSPDESGDGQADWSKQSILAGGLGVFFGVVPVILANRYVFFGNYSHYALPASLAAVLFIVGLLYSLRSRAVRLGVVCVITLLAALTHYSVSEQVLNEEKVSREFWQQVVWRAPGIAAGTTLAVNYPSISYAEDVDAVAGPANYLYFPAQTNKLPAVYPLVAIPQMDYSTKDVINGGDKPYGYRTHVGVTNYARLLVISQPGNGSCVHVIDANWPRFSDADTDQILMIGKFSKIDSILTEATAPVPNPVIFGEEPAHGWCYYYQKAELALQKRDWAEVSKLGAEVTRLELRPVDRIEWAPFLQAYAAAGNAQAFKAAAVKIDSSPFVRLQACNAILQLQGQGVVLTEEIRALTKEKLCRGQ